MLNYVNCLNNSQHQLNNKKLPNTLNKLNSRKTLGGGLGGCAGGPGGGGGAPPPQDLYLDYSNFLIGAGTK